MGRPPRITRLQLLECARDVFAAKGFEATTLADIALELGVTPAAVLRHVPSKQALFNEAMRPTMALPQCILDLRSTDAGSDPRVVLRRVAEGWVPFAQTTIAQNIAVQLHARSRSTFTLPFDAGAEDSPPRRGLRIITDYFRRASKAGVIRVDDPRAAALLFMSSLVGYVFIHQIVRAVPRPYPLPDYIDALLDLWTGGAITGGTRARTKRVVRTARGADRR
jgi:AcrR family transcriptional regulator